MITPIRPVERDSELPLEESEMLERLRKWGSSPVPVRDRPSSPAVGPAHVAHIGAVILREQAEQRRRVVKRRATGWLLSVAAAGALFLGSDKISSWDQVASWVQRGTDRVAGMPGSGENSSTSPSVQGTPEKVSASRANAKLVVRRSALPGTVEAGPSEPVPVDVQVGSAIEAGPEGAEIIAEATRAELKEGAAIDVKELSEGLEAWFVRFGSVRFTVDPNRKKRVTVDTVDSRFEVVGTDFTVIAPDPAQESFGSRLVVHHGTVRVYSQNGEKALVGAAGRWPSEESLRRRAANANAFHKQKAPSRASEPRPLATTTLAEENRLFQAGLRARNSGKDNEAIRVFSELMARYPRTSLGREAELEITRARTRLTTGRAP
jgi:FecR protein